MKKLLCILLTLACILSLAACGKTEQNQTPQPNSTDDISQTDIPASKSQTETSVSENQKNFKLSGKGGNRYFGDDVTFVKNSGFDLKYWYTPLKLCVREINITGAGLEKEVLLGVLTDTHLTSNPKAISAFETTMEFASLTDSVVICGDICDNFGNQSNANVFKGYFSEKYKDALCVVGNHDKYSNDADANEAYLKSVWPHDHNYYVKSLGDVLLVGTNNGDETFESEQVDLLKKEIANAQEENKVIILFCHIPLNMLDNTKGPNAQMYELLTNNTDVVKAVVSGHAHGDSKNMLGNLPQYTLEGTGHDYMRSNILLISIK